MKMREGNSFELKKTGTFKQKQTNTGSKLAMHTRLRDGAGSGKGISLKLNSKLI